MLTEKKKKKTLGVNTPLLWFPPERALSVCSPHVALKGPTYPTHSCGYLEEESCYSRLANPSPDRCLHGPRRGGVHLTMLIPRKTKRSGLVGNRLLLVVPPPPPPPRSRLTVMATINN